MFKKFNRYLYSNPGKRHIGNGKNYHPTNYLQLIFSENPAKNRAKPKVIRHAD